MISFAMAGCAPSNSELENYINQVKARKAASIDPIPEMKPFDSFTYPEVEMRDPFALPEFAPQASGNGPRPDPHPKEELEDYPLDSLRMMGTLRQKDALWGLVRDPKGVIHRVKIGNYLGQNYGRITHIDDQQVKLVETISNGSGGWIQREAALAVKE